MKKILALSLLTINLLADEEIAALQRTEVPPSNNSMHRQSLDSACPESKHGWYLFGDALYWHADVGSADWAFKNTSPKDNKIEGPNHSLDFKWSWGFRIGAGANMNYDNWDTNLYYTWFETENSNAVGIQNHRGKDNFGVSPAFSQGKIRWNIHYSMVDWELGRWYYVGQKLSLRPHIGIRGGWIDQKIHEEFKGKDKEEFKFHTGRKNDFWGIGAAGGANTLWSFIQAGSHRFSFFGDFAAALFYGHFNSRHREIEKKKNKSFEFRPHDLSRNLAVPMLQGMFGLSWDTPFNRDRSHFGLKVGYEIQYWFRQNQFLVKEARTDQVVGYIRASDDLAFQGLTLDFKFDF